MSKDFHLDDDQIKELLQKCEGVCYEPPIKELEKQLQHHPYGEFSTYEMRECDLCKKVDYYIFKEGVYYCRKCWVEKQLKENEKK